MSTTLYITLYKGHSFPVHFGFLEFKDFTLSVGVKGVESLYQVTYDIDKVIKFSLSIWNSKTKKILMILLITLT